METTQAGKPRVSYAEVFGTYRRPVKYPEGTVAWIIQRYIEAMNGWGGRPAVKPLGGSHLIVLRLVQRSPIGLKIAVELRRHDVIEHCQERILKALPATINQDVTYLSGALKYAGSAWDDCARISDRAVVKAKPFLIKHNLIGKSTPRKVRPTAVEYAMLLEHFAEENKRPLNEIDMVKVVRWQRASSRRISESCRVEWPDWNREAHTMTVHKMKDPRTRNKTKIVALPKAAQALLIEWWETRDPNEPRILPYVSKSCSARFTTAKKLLGIKVRLHDLRRECFTSLVEDEGYSLEEAIMVTGHETIAIPQRSYLAQKPELFHLGPRQKRIAEVLKQINSVDGPWASRGVGLINEQPFDAGFAVNAHPKMTGAGVDRAPLAIVESLKT